MPSLFSTLGLAPSSVGLAGPAATGPLGSLQGSAYAALIEQLQQNTSPYRQENFSVPLFDPRAPVGNARRADNIPGNYIFPASLVNQPNYMLLKIVETVKGSTEASTEWPAVSHIGLPVPTNLAEQFDMKYNELEVGAILGNKEVQAAATKAVEAFKGGGAEKAAAASAQFKKTTETVKNSIVPLVAVEASKAVSDGLGVIAARIAGGIPNPNLALLYQGHGFRTFTFTWKMIPRSSGEAETLKSIILELKKAMHPGIRDLFLTFPHLVEPTIKIDNKELFKIKRCAIKNFSVNYAPSGIPAFYKDDGVPVELDFSLTLQETEIFTREDYVGTASTSYTATF